MRSWLVGLRFSQRAARGGAAAGAALLVAAGLAACSGSGGTARSIPGAVASPTPTATPAGTTPSPTPGPSSAPAGASAVLVLSVPCDALSTSSARSRLAQQRAPQRVQRGARASAAAAYSPASFSLSVQGGGTSVGAIGAPTTSCSASSAIPTYTVSLAAPAGAQTFTISTYASTDGSGTPLSSAIVVATVPSGSAVTLHASLATPVASFSVTAAPNALELGSTATVNVAVNAVDTAGEIIVGPGPYKNAAGANVTIALSDSDTTGSTQLSTMSVTQPGTVVTLTYNGGYSVPATVAIGASSAGFASSSAPVQFACAGAPSTSDLYVLGENEASVDALSQVDRFATTVSGFNPTPAGMLSISSQGGDGVNALTFTVDANGLVSLLGNQPENATWFIATFCPGSDGSLPAYRLFTTSVFAAPDSGNHLALDASHNFYTTSVPLIAYPGQSPAPPELDEYPAGAGAPGVPGDTSPVVSPSRAISGTSTEMVTPIGVAIDSAGNVFVGDQAQINVFGPAQSGNAAPQRTIANTAGGLIGALDAAYDAAGNLYVLYASDNRAPTAQLLPYGDMAVAEFAPGATTPSRVISGPATSLGTYFGQSQPSQLGPTTDIFAALGVAPDGTIFVASFGGGKSPTTGATTGTEIAVFGAAANGNVAPDRTIDVTALANPIGVGVYPGQLAADAHDTVYIGDNANGDPGSGNGVYAFNASGALVGHVAASAAGLGYVTGLAIDAGGDVVVQSVGSSVQGQTALFVYSTAGGGLNGPTVTIPNAAAVPGIAGNRIGVNAAGDVYELSGPSLNAAATEVLEFSLNGTSGAPIGGFSDPQTAFQFPSSVAIDPAGRITVPVIDANAAYVYAPSASGSNVSPVAAYSDYTAATLNVRGAVFASDGTTLYATSCDTDSVSVYANGTAVRSIVGGLTKLACPFALALDAAGTLYVADNNGISVFAAAASGNVAPIRQTRFLQNEQSVGFAVTGVAVGPAPIGATTSASRRAVAARASHTSAPRVASSGGRRTGSGRRPFSGVCALQESERRAAMAKLLPPGHAIPPARIVSPLCRPRRH